MAGDGPLPRPGVPGWVRVRGWRVTAPFRVRGCPAGYASGDGGLGSIPSAPGMAGDGPFRVRGWRARYPASMPVRATKRGDERTPLDGNHDVLICGASFAGLVLARELAGSGASVMVIDRYEIGERQTSACGIPTDWLRTTGL